MVAPAASAAYALMMPMCALTTWLAIDGLRQGDPAARRLEVRGELVPARVRHERRVDADARHRADRPGEVPVVGGGK